MDAVVGPGHASDQRAGGFRSVLCDAFFAGGQSPSFGCHFLQMFFMLNLFSSDRFQVFEDNPWRLFFLFDISWMLGNYFELRCLQVVRLCWEVLSKSSMKVSVWLFLFFACGLLCFRFQFWLETVFHEAMQSSLSG